MIAADIMTKKPRTIRVTAAVTSALDVLSALDVRHLPVVDDDGELIGMLSDRDVGPFLKTFTEGGGSPNGHRVADLMSGDVVSVDTDTDLEEVIETLLEQRIGAVPVVDGDGTLAGIISYVDVLRTYASEISADRPEGRATAKPKAKSKPKAKTKTKTKAIAAPARKRGR